MAVARAVGILALVWFGCATVPGAVPAPGPHDAESIERDAVERASARSLPALRRCYSQELAVDPKVERHLAFGIHVDAKGNVIDSQFVGLLETPAGATGQPRPLPSAEHARCFHHELKTWHLPPTAWRGEIEVEGPPAFVVGFNAPADELPPSAELRAVIAPAFSRRMDGIKLCYEAFIQRRPHSPPLRFKAHVFVSDRQVSNVVVNQPNGADDLLSTCIVGELRGLDFSDAPSSGFDFTYPLSFVEND
jgi:hypothetical protein